MDLSVRSLEPEWMDTEAVDAAEFGRCLGDLAIVNRLTLAHRPVLQWLTRATRGMPSFSLLDVGYGEGGLLRAIAAWADKRGRRARLSGVDLNPSSEIAARAATPPPLAIDYRAGDVFGFVPEMRPDFVVCSLFTHHLTDPQLVAYLRWADATASRGWFIHDLHRHWLAYWGFRAIAGMTNWHRMVRHDGALSIARSFRRDDWRRLLAEAGVAAEIRWRLPFKLCVESAGSPSNPTERAS